MGEPAKTIYMMEEYLFAKRASCDSQLTYESKNAYG